MIHWPYFFRSDNKQKNLEDSNKTFVWQSSGSHLGACLWKGRRHPRLREHPQPRLGYGVHPRTHRGSWRKEDRMRQLSSAESSDWEQLKAVQMGEAWRHRIMTCGPRVIRMLDHPGSSELRAISVCWLGKERRSWGLSNGFLRGLTQGKFPQTKWGISQEMK